MPPHAAQHLRAAHRRGDVRRRERDPARGVAVLPGARGPAAHPQPGRDDPRRPGAQRAPGPAVGVAPGGRRHRAHRDVASTSSATGCAMRSIRGRPGVAEAARRARRSCRCATCASSSRPHRTVRAVRGCQLRLRAGRDAGPGGGVGLGQERVGPVAAGAAAQAGGTITRAARRSRARTWSACPRTKLRRIRGARIAMVFQDPLSSLNPVLTIGRQITEALETHRGMSSGAPRSARSSCWSWWASRTPAKRRRTTTRTSSPAACASAR